LSFNLHHYFVSHYFPTEIYAIFAVGLFYPPILEVIEAPVIEPMFVAIVKSLRTAKEEAIRPIWHNSIRKISLAMLPVLAFSFIDAKQIISVLFTQAYIASVPIFMIAIYKILFAVFIPDNIIKAYGRTNYILKVDIITVICYFFMLLLFIKLFGLIGAALAMIANEFFVKTLLINKARSLLRLSLGSCLPWKHLGLCIMTCFASGLPVVVFNSFVPHDSLFTIVVGLTIFLMVYFFLLFRGSLLSEKEKGAIMLYMSKKRASFLKRRPETHVQ
jgi:O-antigen/teichoic acid export membrane protein